MLVQYEATTQKSVPAVLVGEASTSKAKGKRVGRWKRKKGKGKIVTTTASSEGALTTTKGKGKVNMIANTASWVLDTGCGAHICNNLQVLEKSRKLSKDEMILKLGGGKVVAAEAVGSLSLVISDHIRIELKDCYYVPVLLEKGFPADSQRDEVLLEESSEAPQQNGATYFVPSVPADGVPILRRSTRESRPPERYGLVGLTIQLDNDPRAYGEAMSDIDLNKWLEAIKFEMNSMCSNQVWTLVDPPKRVKPARGKRIHQRPGVDFEETYSLIAMAKSIRVLLAIAVWYDYEIWQIDVKTAFLNGFVEEQIFMDQPEGFTSVG
ncbi:UNVERIFIED_CONTAM: hypothetical protein Scaly_2749100 [Sesamum calycinum]|uniref:Reverse transcriptase Ty1/copia-type domain-containing protein n=1 Tax=Sesamum calycinum TaxID=2727403 RepID=A0AAW2J393_9LAMI